MATIDIKTERQEMIREVDRLITICRNVSDSGSCVATAPEAFGDSPRTMATAFVNVLDDDVVQFARQAHLGQVPDVSLLKKLNPSDDRPGLYLIFGHPRQVDGGLVHTVRPNHRVCYIGVSLAATGVGRRGHQHLSSRYRSTESFKYLYCHLFGSSKIPLHTHDGQPEMPDAKAYLVCHFPPQFSQTLPNFSACCFAFESIAMIYIHSYVATVPMTRKLEQGGYQLQGSSLVIGSNFVILDPSWGVAVTQQRKIIDEFMSSDGKAYTVRNERHGLGDPAVRLSFTLLGEAFQLHVALRGCDFGDQIKFSVFQGRWKFKGGTFDGPGSTAKRLDYIAQLLSEHADERSRLDEQGRIYDLVSGGPSASFLSQYPRPQRLNLNPVLEQLGHVDGYHLNLVIDVNGYKSYMLPYTNSHDVRAATTLLFEGGELPSRMSVRFTNDAVLMKPATLVSMCKRWKLIEDHWWRWFDATVDSNDISSEHVEGWGVHPITARPPLTEDEDAQRQLRNQALGLLSTSWDRLTEEEGYTVRA